MVPFSFQFFLCFCFPYCFAFDLCMHRSVSIHAFIWGYYIFRGVWFTLAALYRFDLTCFFCSVLVLFCLRARAYVCMYVHLFVCVIISGAISAGHDRSDGGLVSTLLEMAFAGEIGCGLDVDIPAAGEGALDALFSEEVRPSVFFCCPCRYYAVEAAYCKCVAVFTYLCPILDISLSLASYVVLYSRGWWVGCFFFCLVFCCTFCGRKPVVGYSYWCSTALTECLLINLSINHQLSINQSIKSFAHSLIHSFVIEKQTCVVNAVAVRPINLSIIN